MTGRQGSPGSGDAGVPAGWGAMRLFIDWDGCPFLVCPTCSSEIMIGDATQGLDVDTLVRVAKRHDCGRQGARQGEPGPGAAH